MLLHYLAKHNNTSFHSNAVVTVLPELNHSLLDFFSPVDLQLILMLRYDWLNLVLTEFQL